jgi:heme oxygenase (biliverdin-IX-beta and delta-forming)
MSEERTDSPAATARRLVRSLDRATLATSQDGWPYASLVLAAADQDASPLLLLSDLAEHSKNLKRDSRASLLFDGTAGRDDPLTGPRVTVLGEMKPVADPRLMARFTARHPSAAGYAGFADFHLYRLAIARAHLVAGFGRIHAIGADALLSPAAAALAAAESDIVQHMNEDHGEAIELYATRIAGASGSGWRMTGIDPEGIDLRRGGTVLRLDFPAPVGDAGAARAALIRLAQQARGTA